MTTYKRGDIVTLPFIFSDDKQRFKERPALIIQADESSRHPGNFIVAQITSTHWEGNSRVRIEEGTAGWRTTGLHHTSTIALDVVETINQKYFRRKLGRLPDISLINEALHATFALTK